MVSSSRSTGADYAPGDSRRGDRFDSDRRDFGRGRFGGRVGDFGQAEAILVVAEEILVVKASLLAEGEILVMEEIE